MKYRMLTNATPASPIQLGDRSYARTPGTVADIPTIDAGRLGANGYLQLFATGTTTERPNHRVSDEFMPMPGALFYDTTLSALLAFDGAAWRNATTGAVA
jgi:hypothetical protein